MLCIGLKLFRWCLEMPNFLMACKCFLVPYPAFLSQAYFLYFFDIFVISRSLVTLAIIDAAAIVTDFWSPFFTKKVFSFTRCVSFRSNLQPRHL